MSTLAELNSGVQVPGLSVEPVAAVGLAAIRFFDPAGEFMTGLAARVGGPMPGPLQAVCHGRILLASRSPNDTLLVCDEPHVIAALEDFAAGRHDGCVVNQTGAYRLWDIAGERAPEFLARLGSAAQPALGEARLSRVAELTVLTASVEAGRTLVVVDRLYSEHLAGWMAETLTDF